MKDCRDAVFIFYIWPVKWRWYIPGLVLALAFVGMGMQHPSTDANQEIIVHFTASSVSEKEAQEVISRISHQLEEIGAADIHFSTLYNGSLKITYYSSLEVSRVKALLYRENSSSSEKDPFFPPGDFPKAPFNEGSLYRFDVVNISDGHACDQDFNGLPVETKSARDQYVKPKFPAGAMAMEVFIAYTLAPRHFEIFGYSYLPVEEAFPKIPESRAGPIS